MRPFTLTSILVLIAAAPRGALAQTAVTGVAYAQYAYQLADTANHANGFDVARAYVNLLSRAAGGVSTRVTADIYRQAGDNSLRYRLKYAYLVYAPERSPFAFKIGQIQTPWTDWAEALWDYRLQGTIALDRNGYLSSSDFGAGADARWHGEAVNASLAVINGEGYNGGTGDQRKDVAGRVSVRLRATDDSSRVGGVRLTGYAHVGKPTSGGSRRRFAGLASVRSKRLTLGAEYAVAADSVTTGPVALTRGRVITVFGVYRVPASPLAAIARFDAVDPNTSAAGDRADRIIAGVSYQLAPSVRLLVDVDHVTYQGTPTPAQAATRSQLTFRAQFGF